jgi:hypothetical protein
MADGNGMARWSAIAQGGRERLAASIRAQPQRAAWLALVVCMAVWTGWECLRPLESAGLEVDEARPRSPSLPVTAAIVPESLNALEQRVLFKARSQVSNVSVQATAQELLKKLQLRGISRQGQTPIAYIQVKGESIRRVAAGEKVAEFTVVQVDGNGVRLELGGEQVVLGF